MPEGDHRSVPKEVFGLTIIVEKKDLLLSGFVGCCENTL